MTEVIARVHTSAGVSLGVFDGNCLPYCIGGFPNVAPSSVVKFVMRVRPI